LAKIVTDKLRLLWSLNRSPGGSNGHPHDESCRVSHETIIEALHPARRTEKASAARRTRGMRRSRHRTQKTDNHGQIWMPCRSANALHRRDRAVPGHWEGDLLFGTTTARLRRWWAANATSCSSSLQPGHTETVVDALIKTTETAPGAEQFTDVGSRQRGRSQALYARHRHHYFCDPRSLGGAGATRTRTACSANCPRASTSRATTSRLNAVARPLNGGPGDTRLQTPAEMLVKPLR
jgi:IS30 family transposase